MSEVLRPSPKTGGISTFATRKPMRVTATLSWSTYQTLSEQSTYEGRSLSNLIAYILEYHLEGSRRPL